MASPTLPTKEEYQTVLQNAENTRNVWGEGSRQYRDVLVIVGEVEEVLFGCVRKVEERTLDLGELEKKLAGLQVK